MRALGLPTRRSVISELVSDRVRRDAMLLSQVADLIIVGDSPGDLVS